MPPPTKQAKRCSTNSNAHGHTTESTFAVSTDVSRESANSSKSEIPQSNQREQEEQTLQEIVRSLLICAVCLDVPGQTFQCSNGHLICIHCATRLLQQHSSSDAVCPSCRIPLQFGLRRCLLAEQLAAELPSNCQFCGLKMVRKLAEPHETAVCPFRPVTCRFSVVGCQWSGKWNQLEEHISQCTYKEKRLCEVESLLVSALNQSEIWQTERNQFPRALLGQLAKSPGGLKAFRRPACVSRDTQSTELDEGVANYQSTSNLFRCFGLKRMKIEVIINYKQGELRYRIKSRSQQTSEFSFCLCLVRCGDAEFDVNDQLHSFRFSSDQKQSPDYSAKLIYHRTTEPCSSTNKTLDQISVQSWYFGFPLENLKNAGNLILEFIVFKDKNDIFEGNNSELTTQTSNILRESLEAEDPISESPDVPSVDNLAHEGENTNSTISSYWHQALQTPTNSLLRPLLNLFFSNQDQRAGNNNAPLVIGSLPHSMVLTLTSLSPTDARIRLIELGAMSSSTHGETDESDDNSSLEADATNTTEEDEEDEEEDEETDSEEDDESENGTYNFNRETAREETNNNALVDEQDEDGLGTSYQRSTNRHSRNTKRPRNSDRPVSQSSHGRKNYSNTEQFGTPNCNHACCVGSSVQRRTPQRRQTRRIQSVQRSLHNRSNNPRGWNRNRNMSGEKLEGDMMPDSSAEHTINRKRRSSSNEDDYNKSISESFSDQIDDRSENVAGPSINPLPHSQHWLGRMMENLTGIARFLVRPHVAAPLADFTTAEYRTENYNRHQNQSASENLSLADCQNNISIFNPKEVHKTSWTLPTSEKTLVIQKIPDTCKESKYMPADSLNPPIHSLRANIGGEIIDFAKGLVKKQRQECDTNAKENVSETHAMGLNKKNIANEECQVTEDSCR